MNVLVCSMNLSVTSLMGDLMTMALPFRQKAMVKILLELKDRQLSITHLLQTKLGRTVRKLRSKPGTTGTLASASTRKCKAIIEAAEDKETEDFDDLPMKNKVALKKNYTTL